MRKLEKIFGGKAKANKMRNLSFPSSMGEKEHIVFVWSGVMLR